MKIKGTKTLRILAALIVVIIITGYAYFQTKGFAKGPVLVVNYPLNGTTLKESLVQIKGYVRNTSYMELDGRQIFVNEAGKFDESLLLFPGYNVIKIKIKDRFNRIKIKKIGVIYKPAQKTPANKENNLLQNK